MNGRIDDIVEAIIGLLALYYFIELVVYLIQHGARYGCYAATYIAYMTHHIGLAHMYILRHIRMYSIVHEYPQEHP